MYYWATNKQFKVETALLQFLSNLDNKNSFVYWTIRAQLRKLLRRVKKKLFSLMKYQW